MAYITSPHTAFVKVPPPALGAEFYEKPMKAVFRRIPPSLRASVARQSGQAGGGALVRARAESHTGRCTRSKWALFVCFERETSLS